MRTALSFSALDEGVGLPTGALVHEKCFPFSTRVLWVPSRHSMSSNKTEGGG